MKFFIYHHNDFDGIASAAIFAKFLSLKDKLKFSDFEFVSIDYDLKGSWIRNKLKRPCAVIDFLYHPNADWWFDHHDSTFLNSARLKDEYKHSPQKYWNTKFLSCPSLLMTHFSKYYSEYLNFFKKEYKDIIKWADIIDGAAYKSPKEIFGFKNKFLNINKTLGVNHSKKYSNSIIKSFFNNDLDSFFNSREYKKALAICKKKEREAISVIKKIIKVDHRIAFFDQSDYNLPFQRYLSYYLFPSSLYRIAIYKKDKKYSISVNFNIWAKEKNWINLGELCKQLGGGGRFNVGAILVNNHKNAYATALRLEKMIKNLLI